jgi:hypothetical protein
VLTNALNDGVVDAAMFHAGGNRKRRLFVPQEGLNPRAHWLVPVLQTAGEFEPLVEGSTKPVAKTRRHAGIVRVAIA